jgi:hypothetical protein
MVSPGSACWSYYSGHSRFCGDDSQRRRLAILIGALGRVTKLAHQHRHDRASLLHGAFESDSGAELAGAIPNFVILIDLDATAITAVCFLDIVGI